MVEPWAPMWMPASSSGGRMTLDEWASLPEDHGGELVDGALEEEEVPDPVHELALTWLIAVFRSWLAGGGFVFGSEVKLRIDAARGRKADMVVGARMRRIAHRPRCVVVRARTART